MFRNIWVKKMGLIRFEDRSDRRLTWIILLIILQGYSPDLYLFRTRTTRVKNLLKVPTISCL